MCSSDLQASGPPSAPLGRRGHRDGVVVPAHALDRPERWLGAVVLQVLHDLQGVPGRHLKFQDQGLEEVRRMYDRDHHRWHERRPGL